MKTWNSSATSLDICKKSKFFLKILCTWVFINMVKKEGEIAKQSSLIGLTDSSKVTQKSAAVGHRGCG